MALATYILQLRRVLHDATGQQYTDAQLTDYINEARNRVAMDSGCVRILNTLTAAVQREQYPFNGTLLQCTVTVQGTGYTTLPTIAFTGGGGSGAAAQAGLGVITVAPNAAGTAYKVGDVVTPQGGTVSPYVISTPGNTSPGVASFLVATINGTGGITGLTISQQGNYSVIPGTANVALSGGSGANGTVNLTYGVTAVNMTNPGGDTQNGGLLYTSAPAVGFSGGGGVNAAATANISSNVIDVLGISVIWNNLRVALNYAPFSIHQARLRAFSLNYQVPGSFSIFGIGTAGLIYLFPLPNQVYAMEVDTKVIPNPLVSDTTPEQVVYPFSDAIRYYAAFVAKQQEQAFDEAERFRIMYMQRMRECLATAYERRLPSMYSGGWGAGGYGQPK